MLAAERLVYDYRTADLPPDDRQLCDYAIKLTLTPGSVDADDVDRLRENGFSDAQITIAVQVIGYFNYINRIADGLGVESEAWMTLDPQEWSHQKGRNYL